MKLIVGLGNHGKAYELTRHNMGYLAADYIAREFGATPWQEKHKGLLCEAQIKGHKTLILKPQTYMNLSGESVLSVADYYKIAPQDIVILSDDLDLPFGTTRFRSQGRDGGQKGLRDIFAKLGNNTINRVKFGISNEHKALQETADFVLSKLSKEEQEQLPKILQEGAEKMIKSCFEILDT
ncbi:MAG TPA: aminoacyl-tRNA hydrolase [Candidatus Gracilibacteria bacterium]